MGCVSVRPVKFSSSAGISLSSWIQGHCREQTQGWPKNLEDWRQKGKVSDSEGIGRGAHGKGTSLIVRKLEFYAEQGSG